MTAPENRPAQSEPQNGEDRLRAELHLMKTAGIIEVAVRNPSVAEYMEHWEGRVAALAAKCEALERERGVQQAGLNAMSARLWELTSEGEALATKCEALERERDALDRGLSQAMSDTEAAMRTLWETAARVRSLEEALRKEREELMREYDAASDDDDTLGWSLAGRIQAIDEALSTPREDPSGFDIKHDPNEPLPSYHWDFEDTREEGKT